MAFLDMKNITLEIIFKISNKQIIDKAEMKRELLNWKINLKKLSKL